MLRLSLFVTFAISALACEGGDVTMTEASVVTSSPKTWGACDYSITQGTCVEYVATMVPDAQAYTIEYCSRPTPTPGTWVAACPSENQLGACVYPVPSQPSQPSQTASIQYYYRNGTWVPKDDMCSGAGVWIPN